MPGFVTDTKLDGDARIVTFANGTVAREILVDCDDNERRLVYAIVSERIKQHSASAQVFAEGDGRTRFVWIADVLPNEIAPYMDAQMDLGLAGHAEGVRATHGAHERDLSHRSAVCPLLASPRASERRRAPRRRA